MARYLVVAAAAGDRLGADGLGSAAGALLAPAGAGPPPGAVWVAPEGTTVAGTYRVTF